MPPMMDPRLAEICAVSGVFLRREAVERGYDDVQLAALVRAGVLSRFRYGAYAARATWDAADENARHLLRARAAVRTSATEVVASHVTSVIAHGADIWGLPVDEVHLTRLDRRAGRRAAGVVQHRGDLTDQKFTTSSGLRHTSGTRAALEVMSMRDTTVETAVVTTSSLLHRGVTTPAELQAAADEVDRWPHTLAVPIILALADGRLESVGESRTIYLCWAHGLPAPTPQVPILDEHGIEFARVDFAWPELGVFLEFDGRVKYSDHLRDGESVTDAVLREKRREERVCEVTGWRCIRITWADLENPQRTADRIRRILGVVPRRAA